MNTKTGHTVTGWQRDDGEEPAAGRGKCTGEDPNWTDWSDHAARCTLHAARCTLHAELFLLHK